MIKRFVFGNFFETELIEGVSPFETQFSVPPSAAQLLPLVAEPDDEARLVLWDGTQEPEIVSCTINEQTGVLVVVRGREGTLPKAWLAGTQVLSTITAEVMNEALAAYFDAEQLGSLFVARSGSVMSGPLTLSGPPTQALHAVTKQYVDNLPGDFLPRAGGTMTGPINMDGRQILMLPTPVTPEDVATKGYVDTELNEAKENVKPLTTTGTAAAYVITLATTPSVLTGFVHDIVFHEVNDAAPTLEIEGFGARPLRLLPSEDMAAGVIEVGIPHRVLFVEEQDAFMLSAAAGRRVLADEIVLPRNISPASFSTRMVGGMLTFFVGAEGLTIAVKTLSGSDPSPSEPVLFTFSLGFGHQGRPSIVRLTTAKHVTIPVGASLGLPSTGVPANVWVVACLPPEGTEIELGVVQLATPNGIIHLADGAGQGNTINSSSDVAGAIYVPVGFANQPIMLLGRLEWWDGLSTIGVWPLPTFGTPFSEGMVAPGASVRTVTIPQAGIAGYDGPPWATIGGLSSLITPVSPANHIHIRAMLSLGGTAGIRGLLTVTRNGQFPFLGDAAGARSRATTVFYPSAANVQVNVSLDVLDTQPTPGTRTYDLVWGLLETGAIWLNRSETDADDGNSVRGYSTMTLTEIQS